MNILFTAAVEDELMCAKIAYQNIFGGYNRLDNCNDIKIDYLITGIGVTSATYLLTKSLLSSENKYDLIVNIGIAGSFSEKYPIGSVLRVMKEQFADLGVESRYGFQTLFQYELLDKNTIPFKNGVLYSPYVGLELEEMLNDLPKVSGITVQTITGVEERLINIKKRFNPDIESMEGAAVFYVALMEKIPFLEIRSISNFVGERDKTKWNTPLAINNLKNFCENLLRSVR
jgi:futalosine hydrolase